MDPFAVFGLPVSHDLEPHTLERRYLELSRACHPDHHQAADADAQIALLSRAADVNDAYRVLRDDWRRAEAVLAQRAPDALEATKTLSPTFLLAAMELAESVAECPPGPAADALRLRLQSLVADDLAAIRSALSAAQWRTAATRLHESRYHRKALHDLTA